MSENASKDNMMSWGELKREQKIGEESEEEKYSKTVNGKRKSPAPHTDIDDYIDNEMVDRDFTSITTLNSNNMDRDIEEWMVRDSLCFMIARSRVKVILEYNMGICQADAYLPENNTALEFKSFSDTRKIQQAVGQCICYKSLDDVEHAAIISIERKYEDEGMNDKFESFINDACKNNLVSFYEIYEDTFIDENVCTINRRCGPRTPLDSIFRYIRKEMVYPEHKLNRYLHKQDNNE